MPDLSPEISACAALALALAALLVGCIYRERIRRSAIEEELRQSESRYRAIFETAVDAIIVSDQHGIIQEFNKAAERMTGYLMSEIAGQNMRVLLPPALRREHDRYTARYLWTMRELEVCRKDGTLFPAHSVDRRVVVRRTPSLHRHPARPHQPKTRANRTEQARSATAPSPEDGGDRQSDRRHGA